MRWPLTNVGPFKMAFQRSSMAANLIRKNPFPKGRMIGRDLSFQILIILSNIPSLEIFSPTTLIMTDWVHGAMIEDFSDLVR